MAKKQTVNPVTMQRKINNGRAANNRRVSSINAARARVRLPNGRFK